MSAVDLVPSHKNFQEFGRDRFLQMASYVPVLGVFPSWFQNDFLAKEISITQEAPRLIQLIELKNGYLSANFVRGLVTAALVIVGVAASLMALIRGIFLASLHLVFAYLSASRLNYNRQVIDKLQREGLTQTLLIA